VQEGGRNRGMGRLRNDKLHNVCSPDAVRMIKPGRMRWALHVAGKPEKGITIQRFG
jgi:hypothetical protein